MAADAGSDLLRPRDHLLARDFHVVRLGRVLLKDWHDLVLSPSRLPSTFAANHELLRGLRSNHYAQDRRHGLRLAQLKWL